MGKLIKCKDCGHQISKKAEACPNCGAPQKSEGYGCGSVIVLSALVIFGIASMNQGGGDYSSSPSGSSKSTREADRESAWIDKGKDAVRQVLKDSDSAVFRNVYFHRGADEIPMTCGEVNSKNSFGGYTGFQYFVSAGKTDLTYLQEQVEDFHEIWNRFCTG